MAQGHRQLVATLLLFWSMNRALILKVMGVVVLVVLLLTSIQYVRTVLQRKHQQEQAVKLERAGATRNASDRTARETTDAAFNRQQGQYDAQHLTTDSLRKLNEALTRRLGLPPFLPARR